MGKRKTRGSGTVDEMSVNRVVAVSEATTTAAVPALPVAPSTDPLGIPLAEPKAQVFAALGDYNAAHDLIGRLAGILDRIAQAPGGELYRQEMIRTSESGQAGFACAMLRACRNKLLAAQPYCSYCPNCHPIRPGRPDPRCKTCGGRGWTTRAAFDSCRDSDRQHILKMRDVRN
jgi:hypothetical protein